MTPDQLGWGWREAPRNQVPFPHDHPPGKAARATLLVDTLWPPPQLHSPPSQGAGAAPTRGPPVERKDVDLLQSR